MIVHSNEIVSNYSDLPMLKAYHSIREPFRRENTEHRHTAFEISTIARGHGQYRVGERVYRFAPDELRAMAGAAQTAADAAKAEQPAQEEMKMERQPE